MDHASCARQHRTQITTCDQTEGRNLSTHLDLCVSFVAQKMSQNGLRIVTEGTRKEKQKKGRTPDGRIVTFRVSVFPSVFFFFFFFFEILFIYLTSIAARFLVTFFQKKK